MIAVIKASRLTNITINILSICRIYKGESQKEQESARCHDAKMSNIDYKPAMD